MKSIRSVRESLKSSPTLGAKLKTFGSVALESVRFGLVVACGLGIFEPDSQPRLCFYSSKLESTKI